ncbi:MAG: hypothetical protein R2932_50430 [Caldilineaceae bacterium]
MEPLRADNPLLPLVKTHNLLLTPHTAAGVPSDPNEAGRNSDYANLMRFIEGKPLHYCLTPRP